MIHISELYVTLAIALNDGVLKPNTDNNNNNNDNDVFVFPSRVNILHDIFW